MPKQDPGDLISRCADLCRRRERSDLVARLDATAERWRSSDVRVLVVGEFKQGKSMLVNALVGAPVCPVHDDIATSVPLTVRYADPPHAVLQWGEAGSITEDEPQTEEIDISSVTSRVSAPGADRVIQDDAGRRLVGGLVGLPRQLLQDGLALVDTPGVGGLNSSHAAATRSVMPSAHAILVVTDASQELTSPEVELIRHALAACPHVAVVLTKTDLHGQWRRVKELNTARLAAADLKLPQLAVSSQLRQMAARTQDKALNDESGFPELLSFLRTSVVARKELLAERSVRHDLSTVLNALDSSLDSEHRVLTSPDALPSVVAELNEARSRAELLKKRSATWQQTLNDGVQDLNADVDHDLRDRIRVVQAEAERVISDGDPGHAWPDFVQWLEESTAEALAETFTWAEHNADWLIRRVAEHFEEGSAQALPDLRLSDTSTLGDRFRPIGQLDLNEASLAGKVIIWMKGSYGGVLMFGILTGLAGLTLVNPITIGAGILLGGRAYREDAQNRLARRQAEARTLVRKQLDEVTFQSSKVLRDRMRHTQRSVRDHYAQVADDLSRSIAESVASAQSAAKVGEQEKQRRLAAIAADRTTVTSLQEQARSLGGPLRPPRQETTQATAS